MSPPNESVLKLYLVGDSPNWHKISPGSQRFSLLLKFMTDTRFSLHEVAFGFTIVDSKKAFSRWVIVDC